MTSSVINAIYIGARLGALVLTYVHAHARDCNKSTKFSSMATASEGSEKDKKEEKEGSQSLRENLVCIAEEPNVPTSSFFV